MPPKRAILLPGNGCPGEGASFRDCMWYGWLARRLRDEFGIECIAQGFPDPLYAKEDVWKMHCVATLGLDKSTLMIGHSSGAACALRLMEEHETAGCVLVSAYDDDLGDDLERASGYFNRPFDFERMVANTPFVLQFHSKNDHLVPFECGQRVADGLKSDFHVHEADGHFQDDEYDEIVDALRPYFAEAEAAEGVEEPADGTA